MLMLKSKMVDYNQISIPLNPYSHEVIIFTFTVEDFDTAQQRVKSSGGNRERRLAPVSHSPTDTDKVDKSSHGMCLDAACTHTGCSCHS